MNLFSIIPILLTLGTSPDCEGFGICTVDPPTEMAVDNCAKLDHCMMADLDYADGEFVLTISQSKLKDKVFIKYFTKEYFTLDKDFYIYNELAAELGAPANSVIPQGKYPISEEHGKIVVRFKL